MLTRKKLKRCVMVLFEHKIKLWIKFPANFLVSNSKAEISPFDSKDVHIISAVGRFFSTIFATDLQTLLKPQIQ
jgi:hypothetical protein